MERREFLRQVAMWTAGATAIPPLFRIERSALAAETASQSVMSLAKGSDYGALALKVLEPLGGMGAFVKKGAKVVIKPNIGWDRKPDQAANTHPEIVKALAKAALDAGASRVMVFDRSCDDGRRCYAASGILEAVTSLKDDRATCTQIDDRKYTPVNVEKGKAVTRWEFYKDAMQADCYINVPIAKHHQLSKLTLGVKNIMGVIGGNRGQIHKSLGQKVADLNTVLRPKLTIMDATRILLKNGPTGGKLEDVKVLDTMFASTDMVAVDAYATTLFGLKPEEIESTKAAHELGLGEIDLDRVKIVKL